MPASPWKIAGPSFFQFCSLLSKIPQPFPVSIPPLVNVVPSFKFQPGLLLLCIVWVGHWTSGLHVWHQQQESEFIANHNGLAAGLRSWVRSRAVVLNLSYLTYHHLLYQRNWSNSATTVMSHKVWDPKYLCALQWCQDATGGMLRLISLVRLSNAPLKWLHPLYGAGVAIGPAVCPTCRKNFATLQYPVFNW